MREIFSKNFRRLRKISGYSQRELAKKVKISQRMIHYYENEPNTIQIDKLKNIALSLNANISDFFNEDKDSLYIENIDVRWLKKIKAIKKLPEKDIREINRHINTILEKNSLIEKNKLIKP